jgi:Cu+-exporting ATPase
MHPEVAQDKPGSCPKCGMTLELKSGSAAAGDDENAELHDMTRRFWIGATLALPVFLLAMAHLLPSVGAQSWVAGPFRDGFSSSSPPPWSGGRAGRFSNAAGALW